MRWPGGFGEGAAPVWRGSLRQMRLPAFRFPFFFRSFVARLQRSESRDRHCGVEAVPAFAPLKPGYGFCNRLANLGRAGASRERFCLFTSPRVPGEEVRSHRGRDFAFVGATLVSARSRVCRAPRGHPRGVPLRCAPLSAGQER